MLIIILSVILFLAFTFLGVIHFYWIVGEKWGLDQAIPTRSTVEKPVPPPTIATIFVGLVLIIFGLIYLIKSGFLNIHIPSWIMHYGLWIIPCIFIIRAIGEFNYIGFFKKVKNTKFANADSKIFSPLCLGIGICGLLIQLLS